jgi:hypothetical protein
VVKPINIEEEIVVDLLPHRIWLSIRTERQKFLVPRINYVCECQDCAPNTCDLGDRIKFRLCELRTHITEHSEQHMITSVTNSIAVLVERSVSVMDFG